MSVFKVFQIRRIYHISGKIVQKGFAISVGRSAIRGNNKLERQKEVYFAQESSAVQKVLTQTQAVEQYVRGITRNVQKFKRF
jgi:hypothetical protein